MVKQTPSSPNQTRRLSQLHGQKLPLVIGKATAKEPISLKKLCEFGDAHWLSQNQMRALGTFLGKNDVEIEIGLQKELVLRNHILDDYYEVRTVDFLIKDEFVKKPIVVAKDASDLIMHVFELRNQHPTDFIVKFYFDGGQKYLKLSCSLIPKEGWEKKQKKGRSWNGANTVIPLAIAHTVPENHYNVDTYYKNCKFHKVKGIKALDHKMKNIDTGIMPCSCSYPCINCKVFHTKLGECGVERTVADLANDYESWLTQTGGDEKLGKFFWCQVHSPKLFATLLEHKLCQEKISDLLVPSALHDFLGIMNHFLHELGHLWPVLTAEWLKHANVSKEGYWQGTYLGNPLRDLLEDLSFLEDEYGYAKEPLMAPYIQAMRSFNEVRLACMGMELDEDYARIIKKFQSDYLVLEKKGFSVILKAHDVFYHYIDWLDRWKLPLGLVGEQAGEAIHCRFNKFIQCKQCSSPESPDFGEHLLKVVVAWASHAAILVY